MEPRTDRPRSSRPGRVSRILATLALALVSLALAGVAGEVFLRLLGHRGVPMQDLVVLPRSQATAVSC